MVQTTPLSNTGASEETHTHSLTHTHTVQFTFKRPTDVILKQPFCKKTLKRCDGVLVHLPDLQFC